MVSIGNFAWVRLEDDQVRFTIAPEQGTQVWAVLATDTIFERYSIQSAAPNNTINLEVPIDQLLRALKSAYGAASAALRLTKKDNVPVLALTIRRNTITNAAPAGAFDLGDHAPSAAPSVGGSRDASVPLAAGVPRDVETIVTQNVAVRVLPGASVEGIREPRCREPDVHIMLPSLSQIKGISDRFTKIATGARSSGSVSASATLARTSGPRLEFSANMHGSLRLRTSTDALSITSVWHGLTNPELDPTQVEGGEEGIRNHPSTRMRQMDAHEDDEDGDSGWATVRIDGRDWSRVLSVGRLGGRVIACFVHDQALILYVYLSTGNDDDGDGDQAEGSILTYYINSYSA